MKAPSSYGLEFQQATADIWGLVMAVQANFYWVQLVEGGMRLDALPLVGLSFEALSGPSLLCTRRSRLKKTGQRVMVGDWVRVEEPDWAGERGAIAEIYPRHTVLSRPPIANADQLLLMFALAEPDLDPQQLSRFLVKAESTGLRVRLCLNKQDLVSPAEQLNWQERLRQWGYDPVVISVHTDASQASLARELTGRMTVVSGPSGVGKSSLINQLVPQAELKTGAVSGKLGRGRHTTRHVELLKLPLGGFLADTPGFNQPEISLTPARLADAFPEIRQRLAQARCQFNDCLHRDEPGCVVGSNWDRYGIYTVLLGEAMATQSADNQRGDPEATFKIKTGETGLAHQEPMLKAKKYRRISRRSQKQAMDELRSDWPNSGHRPGELEEFPQDG